QREVGAQRADHSAEQLRVADDLLGGAAQLEQHCGEFFVRVVRVVRRRVAVWGVTPGDDEAAGTSAAGGEGVCQLEGEQRAHAVAVDGKWPVGAVDGGRGQGRYQRVCVGDRLLVAAMLAAGKQSGQHLDVRREFATPRVVGQRATAGVWQAD